MMDVWTLAATAAAGWLLYRLLLRPLLFDSGRRLPPGPPSLPLIGCHLWAEYPLRDWIVGAHPRQYGPVSSFRLNGRLFVCLNTYEAIREAFVTQGSAFAGRPDHVFSQRMFGNSGLVISEGPVWKRHRRFSLQVLRDFGFGKLGSEESIAKEAAELVEALEAAGEEPVDAGGHFARAVSNVICRLVFGRRLATEDPTFDEKLAVVNKITQSTPEPPNLLMALAMPLYMRLAPDRFMRTPRIQRIVQLFESVLSFCQKQIDRKKVEYSTEHEPADYVEAYLSERSRLEQQNPQEAAEFFTDKKLQVSIMDLFMAGTDTTSNSLRWVSLHLALEPQLQERLHGHVSDAIGRRMPRMADRSSLPLVESFILETQRYDTLVPTGVQHRAVQDATVLGHFVPRGAAVFANVQAVHQDAANFEEPLQFRPDRFVGADGKFKPSDRVIPFLIGKRSCLGESLARMELFLFTVVLLQSFRVSLPPEESARQSEIFAGTGGTVRAPRDHRMIFARRLD